MMKPTAVIAEDEPLLRGELLESLRALWPELQVVAEARDGVEAAHALATHEPTVLFLDIQMPGISGLDVARAASGRAHVVFITAYDEYAVAAFEQGAVDYVMKPFSAARLAVALDRLRDKLRGRPADLDRLLQTLAERGDARKPWLRWVSVARGPDIQLITVDEVCYIQADNKYSLIATAARQELVRKTIREFAEQLDPEVFWQIHRGTIVNVNAIARVHRDARGYLHVGLKARPESLPVSMAFAHRFRQA